MFLGLSLSMTQEEHDAVRPIMERHGWRLWDNTSICGNEVQYIFTREQEELREFPLANLGEVEHFAHWKPVEKVTLTPEQERGTLTDGVTQEMLAGIL